MISNLLVRATQYLFRKKAFFFLTLAGLGLFLSNGLRKLNVSESIFDSLPKSSAFTDFQKLISDSRLDNRVLFALDVPPGTDPGNLRDTVALFGEQLKSRSAEYLTGIREFRENMDSEVMEYVLDHFPELIDPDYYATFSDKITKEAIETSVIQNRSRLNTPEGTWIKELVLKDPLGITYPFFETLKNSSGATDARFEHDMVLINDGRQVLITAQAAFPSGDSKKGSILFRELNELQQNWNESHPGYTLRYFGGFAVAASNALQIKADAILTMSLALILIFGLLWAYYRNFKTSVVILLPALFGGLCALGMIGYLAPSVSGISLATGAVLLGIALDYSIHFVSHAKHTGSVSRALQDISAPLITGSLTTILAYSALVFANSRLLHDFGLFAGLALSSALAFTLICMPVILRLTGIPGKEPVSEKQLLSVPQLPGRYALPALAAIGIVTIILYRVADGVSFDGDPRQISIQTEALQQAEKLLTPIDPETDVQLFVFASSENDTRASAANSEIYRHALKLEKNNLVKSFSSAAPFVVSDSLRAAGRARWNSYWQSGDRATEVVRSLREAGKNNGFSPGAFSFFENSIEGNNPSFQSEEDTDDLVQGLGIDNLIHRENGKSTYITTLVVEKEHLEAVKAAMQDVADVQVFHRMEMVESLLEVVKEDFNYILFVSAAIVFIALLLLYGRLELALLSFLPMVISWIWILGITVLMGVKFNFVNVVFATFIFGLGDDFSIFMTDGLLQRYRQGRNKLASYTSAISLSGLTVLIGTGVLLFASHPALKSIAVVSVPGIICIVLVSLVFQPLVFGLFVQNRVDKGRTPISIWTFIKTWFCFTFFVCMCYLAFIVMVVLILLPVGRKKKKEWLARAMSALSAAVMYSGTQIRKRTYGREYLEYDKPAILIANHASFLDIMIMLMHHPKAVIMVKEWVYKSPLYGWVIRYANYLFMEEGPEANLEQARELVKDGYSIIIFPEGTRSDDGKVKRFHKGAFYLAEQLNLSIQPVFIHGAGYVSPKNELVIKHGPVNVGIQPRIHPDDLRWGDNFQQRTKSISRHFKAGFSAFQKKMDDTRFMKQRIFNNYIFKGPVLEWYFRIKWELEKNNYEFYDQRIGSRKKILDLGCGYGFLDFYLHYRDEERTILAVDYDEEKIGIAANSYAKNANLSFVQADVADFTFGKQDVIFLNDILHYLTKESQDALVKRCIDNLNPGGILFIRDGITDDTEKHKNTRFTEWMSTKLFSFNKKSAPFHFFSREDIRQLAARYDLDIEERTHSKQTSNMLFILSKAEY